MAENNDCIHDVPACTDLINICENKSDESNGPQFTRPQQLLSVAAAVGSVVFVHLTIFNCAGYLTTLLFMLMITATARILKKHGCMFNGLSKTIIFILYIFSCVFIITSNTFIKFLDAAFLLISGSFLVYQTAAGRKKISQYLQFELSKSFLRYPFSYFSMQIKALLSTFRNKKTGSEIRLVILGLMLAFPLTFVVAGLLMSADDGVKRILSDISEVIFSQNLRIRFLELLTAVPAACWFFGVLYSNLFAKQSDICDDDIYEHKLEGLRKINNTIIYTSVTPVCILYIIFFVSQASYFMSAFYSSIPVQFSYAEYARHGFFELSVIEVINLFVIIFINRFAKQSGKNKPFTLKLYTAVLSLFTLFIIATAVSKMVMYINIYGLTQLRVYTTWFMILSALFFVLIIIKQINNKFNIMSTGAAVFCIMFGLLCFSRPDALITRFNLKYYSDQLTWSDIQNMSSMSDDAVCVILEKSLENELPDDLSYDSKRIKGIKYILENNFYKRTNLSDIIIMNKIK